MQRNDDIKVCSEVGSNVPAVVGNCPSCGLGDRSLIIIDFVRNTQLPEHSTVYLKCMGCSTITQKKIIDIAEET